MEKSLFKEEVELSHRIANAKKLDLEMEYEHQKSVWMQHYHSDLVNMYKILKRGIRSSVSFDEFKMFVFENTERFFDPSLNKKVRPLA